MQYLWRGIVYTSFTWGLKLIWVTIDVQGKEPHWENSCSETINKILGTQYHRSIKQCLRFHPHSLLVTRFLGNFRFMGWRLCKTCHQCWNSLATTCLYSHSLFNLRKRSISIDKISVYNSRKFNEPKFCVVYTMKQLFNRPLACFQVRCHFDRMLSETKLIGFSLYWHNTTCDTAAAAGHYNKIRDITFRADIVYKKKQCCLDIFYLKHQNLYLCAMSVQDAANHIRKSMWETFDVTIQIKYKIL